MTYYNVGLNNKGEWIGKPVTVDRCVSDLVLVDDALDEAMLDPNLQRDTTITNNDDHVPEEAEIEMDNTNKKTR